MFQVSNLQTQQPVSSVMHEVQPQYRICPFSKQPYNSALVPFLCLPNCHKACHFSSLERLCVPVSLCSHKPATYCHKVWAELAPPSDPLLMSTKSMQHVSHLDDNTGLSVSDDYAACAHDSEATSGLTLAHSTGPGGRIKRTFCTNDAPCTACS